MKQHCSKLIISSVMTVSLLLSACQMRPSVKGLPTLPQLQHIATDKQNQVEIKWQKQSFAFLLYQQQHQNYLQVLGLTITGQILFELHYNGEKVEVIQRIDAMKYLPFDYVLRDILWGTLAADVVSPQVQALGLSFSEQIIDSSSDQLLQRTIQSKDKVQLQVQIKDQMIEIDNPNVPYQMIISQTDQNIFVE